jgi:predicted phosphodiesterase
MQYLSKLRPSGKIVLDGTTAGLFHGSPGDPLSEYVFPGIPDRLAKRLIQKAGTSLVLLGHTHMPMFYSFQGEMVGNPGSVGQPRDGDPRASFAILTVSEGKVNFEIRRVEYPVDSVADKISRADLPLGLAERLFIGI